MRHLIKIIVITLIIASCSKERNDKHVASVELNGETMLHFDAQFSKGDDDLFTLFLAKDSELGPEHRLNFYNFTKEVGRTNIVHRDSARDRNLPYSNFSSLKHQRDVEIDAHHSIGNDEIDSWIEIDEIGYRRIEGRFQVIMETAAPSEFENTLYPYLTDTLIFREGKFVARRFY